jgi:beta-phosphoglucomutase-like phosphatase (HAD superfamily)
VLSENANDLETLAVDLDGTLLRSDMLLESFWSAFSRDWTTPFRALYSLFGGRASLKRDLARRSSVDVTSLPYDSDVIDFIKDWRVSGGRIALVTASDQEFADSIAAHIGLFDEVYG